MISVLLVDDQALIRQAFAALLELETDLTVVGQAADAAIAVELVAARRPDVVLMDVQLGAGEDGLSATARITAAHPGTRVIVLTTFGRPGYLRRAMEAGAVGFIVKDAPADRLVEAHPPRPSWSPGCRSGSGCGQSEHRHLAPDRSRDRGVGGRGRR